MPATHAHCNFVSEALYQSRAAITILTVMTSPQHVHGKNCHAFLSPRQYAIHCLLFMNGMEMDILFHKSLQQFTECSVYTRMIDNKQIGTAAFPCVPPADIAKPLSALET